MSSERFCELSDGGRMRFLEAGTGKPLVLIHGWPTNANAWRDHIDALSMNHRVIAVDLRGFGDSTPMDQPTIARLAADVHELLASLDIDNAFVIGWSLGGSVVLSYATQFGAERVRGLGIIDVSPKLLPGVDWLLGEGTPFSAEGLAEWSGRWPGDPLSVVTDVYTMGFVDHEQHADTRDWLIGEGMRADRTTAMRTLDDAAAQDYRSVLANITVPALLLFGGHSTSTTPHVRDFFETNIPTSTMVVFEDSGHCLMFEEPRKFLETLDAFALAT
jgi:pimeloyl-ACP methyl ester carboxylesterase